MTTVLSVSDSQKGIAATAFAHAGLVGFAQACLEKVGLSLARAKVVAELLVEADLMGHDTHGLALLSGYVRELESGGMLSEGEPLVVADRAAVTAWDGRYLPGVWLTATALEEASRRATKFGTGTVTIRRSHHIACLQAYLPAVTRRGQVAIICCSDPRSASVAPFGGIDPVVTPNPIACGIPTDGDPILIDISTSITTNALTTRLAAAGERFGGIWALDHQGNPTDDPKDVVAENPGALLPLGGLDYGHKGYSLAIIVEALTQGLAGHGRADPPGPWGASVFVQVLEPECFSGLAAFTRQTGHLSAATRASRPMSGGGAVRMPGQRALERRRRGLADGVSLREDIGRNLLELAERLGVDWPEAVRTAKPTANEGSSSGES